MTLSLFTQPYHFNGRDYVLEIHAHDQNDAGARLRAAFYQSASNPPQEIVFQATAPGWVSKIMGGK